MKSLYLIKRIHKYAAPMDDSSLFLYVASSEKPQHIACQDKSRKIDFARLGIIFHYSLDPGIRDQ